jgi:hypothetical protein
LDYFGSFGLELALVWSLHWVGVYLEEGRGGLDGVLDMFLKTNRTFLIFIFEYCEVVK